jgi:hypothetical protein
MNRTAATLLFMSNIYNNANQQIHADAANVNNICGIRNLICSIRIILQKIIRFQNFIKLFVQIF